MSAVQIPLSQYRMWGLDCALCGSPMAHLTVYKERLEAWHIHDYVQKPGEKEAFQPGVSEPEPCVVVFRDDTPAKRPGGLRKCPRCPNMHSDIGDLCRSCVSQEALFHVGSSGVFANAPT